MTTWHYQVMRYGPFDDEPKYSYGIHEFYILEDKITWTSDAVGPVAESIQELKEILLQMSQDVDTMEIRDYETGEMIDG